MSETTIMGAIINAPIEAVEKMLNEGDYNLTVLTNLKKGLELEYCRVADTKDRLIEAIKNSTDDVSLKEKSESVLKDLYTALQLIEDRAILVQTHINNRKLN